MLVEQATPDDIVTYIGISGWIGWVDDEIACIGGFIRRGERLFAYLDVFNKVAPLKLMREMHRRIAEIEEDVYAVCDAETHASAPHLLRLLGFVATEEEMSGKRIWKWTR